MKYLHQLKVILTIGIGCVLSFGVATETEISFVESSISISHEKSNNLENAKAKRRLNQARGERHLLFGQDNSGPSRYSSPGATATGTTFSAISAENPVSLADVSTNPDPKYTSIYAQGKGKGQSKQGGKGKGGSVSKGKKSKKSKKSGSGSGDAFCDSFDFSGDYIVKGKGKGKGGKGGKGKGGRLLDEDNEAIFDDEAPALQQWDSRELQFGGEDCSPNVFETACSNPNLSIFVRLLEKAGLERVFECAGPFTVVAPSNSALQANPFLLKFLEHPYNTEQLEDFLLYHVIPGSYLEQDFRDSGYKTLQGERIQVTTNPLMFNQAVTQRPDIIGCNGVLHIVDDVLIVPENGYLPNECAALDFRTAAELPRATSSSSIGSGFFHRALQYSGHICDLNVLDTARLNPDLSIFVDMIEVAGLEELFLCAGPFTALIPTNAAFENIDQATIDELLKPANRESLQDLLLFHILPGVHLSNEVEEGTLPSLSTQNVTVTLDPLEFNGVGVLTADISACNGIIHVLEDILPTDPSTDSPNTPSPVTPGTPTAVPIVTPTATPVVGPTSIPTSAPVPVGRTPAPTPIGTLDPTPTAATPGPTPLPTPGRTSPPTTAPIAGTAPPTSAVGTIAPRIPGAVFDPSAADSDEFTRVRLTDYYLVYVVQLLEETLPEDQLALLITNTQDFYASLFEAFYEGTEAKFVGVEITPKEVLFGDALPPADTFNDPTAAWNFYINFDTDVLYEKGSPGISDVATHFDVMAATEADYISYITDFTRPVPNMASTTQVEFESVEIIPESARVIDLGEEVAEEEQVADEKEEVATQPSEQKSSTPPPNAPKVKSLPLASVAAAVSAFMTLAAATFMVMRRRRRNALAGDTARAIKQGNVLDATVTDETASRTSSRSKTNTSEFGAEDMESTSWYE